MQTPEYIANRLNELAQHKAQFERAFYFLEDEELFFIPEGEQWSAIECIEHINNVNEKKKKKKNKNGLVHKKSAGMDATYNQGESTENPRTQKTKTTPPKKSRFKNCSAESHGELHCGSQSD